MTKLIELKSAKDRFARSINLERDVNSDALAGYLPVGRALESVDRLAVALGSGSGESALSITGPYGSGKSSLALLLDALFSDRSESAYQTAASLVEAAAPDVLRRLERAREVCGAEPRGFVPAVVTAQREPVAKTVLRALRAGAERAFHGRQSAESVRLVGDISTDLHAAERTGQLPDVPTIRGYIDRLTAMAPVLLVIDEFGKNLEAFAETPGDGDLFLLQELAEWTRRTQGNRLALVTLQHMAFGDYADVASGVQRREWVKIQGRFEDVPFVDTPEQTRALIAAAFNEPAASLLPKLEKWAAWHAEALAVVGLPDLGSDAVHLAACWPLHPLALTVLPELCHRYGQNERTMFSFLASNEPRSVTRFLAETDLPKSRAAELPVVGLDRVYDYFVESAASMVGVSADASRWIEIDTRIRDTQGLSLFETQVLKVIGLLNLVSTGGSLRASREMVTYAFARSGDRLSSEEVLRAVEKLESAGIITFRDFADEFRVWQGSDVDLKAALDTARRRLRDESAEAVLRRALPLGPVVAARHSYVTGTLRTFERAWSSSARESQVALSADDRADGLILYALTDDAPAMPSVADERAKPIVLVTAEDCAPLLSAARELLAIDEVLVTDESVRADWVVRRELSERRVTSAARLRTEFEQAFGPAHATYHYVESASRGQAQWRVRQAPSVSIIASEVADRSYRWALPFHNELINRHELTSQAAKARREVAEVMAGHQSQESLGIRGQGPDSTLYLSLFKRFGLHRADKDGQLIFQDPPNSSGAKHLWKGLLAELRSATGERRNVADLYRYLALPPFGLREGPAPLLTLAALISHADEIALYEHGTFRPRLGPDVCERLIKNPGNFAIKCFAATSGARAAFVQQLAGELGLASALQRNPNVVGVVGRLVAEMNALPAYSRKTSSLSEQATAIRRAMTDATEPDVLLFEQLPLALGFAPVPAGGAGRWDAHKALTTAICHTLAELRTAYPDLLSNIRSTLTKDLQAEPNDLRTSLMRRSAELRERVIDPRVRALVAALQADLDDEDAWLAYVGMQVTGVPPEGWTDEDRRRFDVNMHDLGAMFRRIEALHADVRAQGGGFEAVRVSVSSTTGDDHVRLLTLDPSRDELVDRVLDEMLVRLGTGAGPDAEAADWLLARLIERQLGVTRVDVGSAAYGDNQRGKEAG